MIHGSLMLFMRGPVAKADESAQRTSGMRSSSHASRAAPRQLPAGAIACSTSARSLASRRL
jgi:hypothetical protein